MANKPTAKDQPDVAAPELPTEKSGGTPSAPELPTALAQPDIDPVEPAE